MAISAYSTNPSQRTEIDLQESGKTSRENRASRIWNVFKPTIVLDEMSILQGSGDPDANAKTEDFTSMAYPFIKINEYIFTPEEIVSMNIDSRGFLPTITLKVALNNKLFISKDMPKDGDIISVMIRNKSDVLNPIRNDYVITGAPTRAIYPNDNVPINLTFFGELFVPGFKSFLGTASFNGTSMEAMKEIADRLTLGFNTNEDDTDDQMIWILAGSPEKFIKDILSKSWKDENSFFSAWIDVYYNLNFVNVQKVLLAPEEEIDPQVFLGNFDIEFTWGNSSDQDESVLMPKVFSNYTGYKNSSNYIVNWKSSNKSSALTFDYGTSIECSFFEHLDLLYKDPEAQKYWSLDINPAYDPEKLNNHILLRGRARWDPSTNEGEQARANYSYKDIYKKAPWLGIQYTITNPDESPDQWTGNQHQNYMRAQANNLINLVELDKLNLEIKVKGTNANVIKGDKVPLVLVKGDIHEAQIANPVENPKAAIDFFYTGWYYIKGFNLSWNRDINTMSSSFSQTYILTRREWNAPEPIDPIPPAENQNNSNNTV